MKVIYSDHYNIDLGVLNRLHPFDGTKFRRVYSALRKSPDFDFVAPGTVVHEEIINEFLSDALRYRVCTKSGVLEALEVPSIPFISLGFLDRKVLEPMRWGVAGTLYGARHALSDGGVYWNLAGGYHHASEQSMEGFCIYNDIGICYQRLLKTGMLSPEDKVLIVDTDAHHGNGNARTFIENDRVTILDAYNAAIYPMSGETRERVDIPVQLSPGTDGGTYLARFGKALSALKDGYRLAFVVAGTDVLASDMLGGLRLTVDDIAAREAMTLKALADRAIPAVVLGGGGYSKESADAMIQSISQCSRLG